MSIEVFIAAVIILGLALVVVAQHIHMHRLHGQVQEASHASVTPKITQPTATQLEAQLKAAYEMQIQSSVKVFGEDLKGTSVRLGEQVSRLTTTVIEEELEAYQKTLEEVRHAANEGMEQIRAAVEQQRVELHKNMEADLAAERQRLADKFNDKLGDVVSSYIAESLGSGVDLGSQMQFIISSLEAHKDDIRKDLVG
jgi:hypothetical protein